MGAVFEVPGWKEFTERCQGVVDKFEEKKLVLMNKMANICLSEISPLIPEPQILPPCYTSCAGSYQLCRR